MLPPALPPLLTVWVGFGFGLDGVGVGLLCQVSWKYGFFTRLPPANGAGEIALSPPPPPPTTLPPSLLALLYLFSPNPIADVSCAVAPPPPSPPLFAALPPPLFAAFPPVTLTEAEAAAEAAARDGIGTGELNVICTGDLNGDVDPNDPPGDA